MERKELTERIIGLETAALEEWNRGNPSPYLDCIARILLTLILCFRNGWMGLSVSEKCMKSYGGKVL